MDLNQYLKQLKQTQVLLSQKQEYELCAEISQLIKAIENKDLVAYIRLNFDVKVLTKAGFLPKKATPDQIAYRVCSRFGLLSIYEYSSMFGEGMGCKYVRYLNGIYDLKKKIIY